MLRDGRVPEKSCSTSLLHPAHHCLPRQEKPGYVFFHIRVVFPPGDGHKVQVQVGWGSCPTWCCTDVLGTGPARSQPMEQLQGGSDTAFPTALMFAIRAGNYGEHFILFMSLQFSFVTANRNKLWGKGSLALPKRCGVFLWSKVHPAAHKPHCWFFIYLWYDTRSIQLPARLHFECTSGMPGVILALKSLFLSSRICHSLFKAWKHNFLLLLYCINNV